MRALLAVFLLSISFPSFATDRLYGEIHGGFNVIQLSDLRFLPIQASVSFGGYFYKTLGVDVNLGGSLNEDRDEDIKLQLENQITLSVRFDSPPTRGVSAFVLIGWAQFDLSQSGDSSIGTTQTVSETFRGAAVSIGVRQQIGSGPFSVVGSYRFFDVDEPLDFDTYTLGVRVAW